MNEEQRKNEVKKQGLYLRLNDGKFLKLRKKIKSYAEQFSDRELFESFYKCFFNTIDTTSYFEEDGSVFVLTGDIPAMWLRDSAAQVMPYLYFAKEDKEVREYLKGVLKRQFQYILIDPYANAFKRNADDAGEWDGCVITNRLPKIVWERKFELDSLCYPLFLICKYYEASGDSSCFDGLFIDAFDEIVRVVEAERAHSKNSEYYIEFKSSTQRVGYSEPKEEKGLVWSGFRPSDDPCEFPYHIPDNMFLVGVLHKLADIFRKILNDVKREELCRNLENDLKSLIDLYGIAETEEYGRIYVSETNCNGNFHFDDDANVPSLLSIPFLEYPYIDEEVYKNTRKVVLSKANKFYYEGTKLKGIGSPHTPSRRVWPLALIMQALTSDNLKEINDLVHMLKDSADGTYYMRESVDCNDLGRYSRPWFAWANSMFAYLIITKRKVIKL